MVRCNVRVVPATLDADFAVPPICVLMYSGRSGRLTTLFHLVSAPTVRLHNLLFRTELIYAPNILTNSERTDVLPLLPCKQYTDYRAVVAACIQFKQVQSPNLITSLLRKLSRHGAASAPTSRSIASNYLCCRTREVPASNPEVCLHITADVACQEHVT